MCINKVPQVFSFALVGCFMFVAASLHQTHAQTLSLAEDVSASITGVDFGSSAWGDYDNDGDLDILLSGRAANGNSVTSIFRNDSGTFSETNSGLTGVSSSEVAWGDYDNDGDLDIALIGKDSRNRLVSEIWRNDQDASGQILFSRIDAGLTDVQGGSVAWGDYDGDGDLDLLLTGNTSSNRQVSSVYRNDLDLASGVRTFVDINAGLTGVFLGDAAWGDYDNDSDLDIVLTGNSLLFGAISRVYRNDNGRFVDANAGLLTLQSSTAAWGDYDNDGDLDLLHTGFNAQELLQSRIYRNDNGRFVNIEAGLTGLDDAEAAWGDYDSDGDLDLWLIGNAQNEIPRSILYINEGGTFAAAGMDLLDLQDGGVAAGDFDNDGDLDVFLHGQDPETRARHAIVYQNDEEALNTPPIPPVLESAFFDGATLSLTWNPATDNETPSSGLTYAVRIQEGNAGKLLMAPMAAQDGYRKLPGKGNVQHNTSYALALDINALSPVPFLTWSVQTIDAGLQGSPFATPGVINLAGSAGMVEDVPGDQGGFVALNWKASDLDSEASLVTHYSIWRALPDTVTVGVGILVSPSEIDPEYQGGAVREIASSEGATFWEWMGNEPAIAASDYRRVVSTTTNKTASRDGMQTYLIVAHATSPAVYFDGVPESGASLDNVAPATPSNILSQRQDDGVLITWDPVNDADLRHYAVFRSESADMDVTAMEPLAIVTESEYLDDSSFPAGTFFYMIVAEDIHDNRSEPTGAFALEVATNTEDAGSERPARYALHQNYPNPFNPSTEIQFDLPEAGPASIVVYNTYGQQVAVVVDRPYPAGRHQVTWEPGYLSSGVYFYAITAGAYTAMKRMVYVK